MITHEANCKRRFLAPPSRTKDTRWSIILRPMAWMTTVTISSGRLHSQAELHGAIVAESMFSTSFALIPIGITPKLKRFADAHTEGVTVHALGDVGSKINVILFA